VVKTGSLRNRKKECVKESFDKGGRGKCGEAPGSSWRVERHRWRPTDRLCRMGCVIKTSFWGPEKKVTVKRTQKVRKKEENLCVGLPSRTLYMGVLEAGVELQVQPQKCVFQSKKIRRGGVVGRQGVMRGDRVKEVTDSTHTLL